MNCKLTLEQEELLNDSFWLAYILKIANKIENLLMRSYLSNFLLFFSSIYSQELIVANLGKISPNITMTKKELKKIRMNNMKLLPTKKTEYIKNKINNMGIDFEQYVFDMTIICNHNLELFDINFRMWEYKNVKKDQFESLNALINTPLTWTKRFLGERYEEIFKLLEGLSGKYLENIEEYKFKCYSYPSCKFFSNELTIDEKIYIMQRYGLIKSIIWLEKIFKEKISIEFENFTFDFEKFLLKIKAIAIEKIGNDRKNCEYKLIKELMIINNKTVDNNFFRINRKVRDNIHYNKINPINKDESIILREYQDIYLKNLISIFDSNINVKFDFRYKFALALAKLEYWSRNEGNRKV